MKKLLQGKFSPVTDRVGFQDVPFDDFVETYAKWFAVPRPTTVAVERFESSLSEALLKLEPLNSLRILLAETRSSWTAIFTSTAYPDSAVHYLAYLLPSRGIIVSCIEDTYQPRTGRGRPGGVQFTLSEGPAADAVEVERRSISATNQCERWEWHQHGVPLPFEHPERYQARRIRDRFTWEMLEEYCVAFGIRPFDEDFYGPRFALIYDTAPWPAGYEQETYQMARRARQIE